MLWTSTKLWLWPERQLSSSAAITHRGGGGGGGAILRTAAATSAELPLGNVQSLVVVCEAAVKESLLTLAGFYRSQFIPTEVEHRSDSSPPEGDLIASVDNQSLGALLFPSVGSPPTCGCCWGSLSWPSSTPWPASSPGSWSSPSPFPRWMRGHWALFCSCLLRTSMCPPAHRGRQDKTSLLIPCSTWTWWDDSALLTCLFLCSAQHPGYETRALLCCYQAVNWYYYKYTVDGINVFAVSILCWSVSCCFWVVWRRCFPLDLKNQTSFLWWLSPWLLDTLTKTTGLPARTSSSA